MGTGQEVTKQMSRFTQLSVSAAALMALAAPAAAHKITVRGTASVDFNSPDLATLHGFVTQIGGTIEFELITDAPDYQFAGPGSFVLKSYSPGGVLLDTLELAAPFPTYSVIEAPAYLSGSLQEVDFYNHYTWAEYQVDTGTYISGSPGSPGFSVDLQLMDMESALLTDGFAAWDDLAGALGTAHLADWEERNLFICTLDIPNNSCDMALIATPTSLVTTVERASTDSDGDGVADANDQCPGSAGGDVTDANGCSIEQLIPCAGPSAGSSWRNHGAYVREVSRICNELLAAGIITQAEKDAIMAGAAGSTCGN
jgi:hypothetical protein